MTVLYGRDNPLDARIESSSGKLLRWTWTLITGAFGLASATSTVLIYRVFIHE